MQRCKRRKLGRKILLILTLSIICITAATNLIKVSGEEQTQYIEYNVSEGETIWSIATDNNIFPDIREMVYEIKKINHNTDNLIYPGQILKIPCKYK